MDGVHTDKGCALRTQGGSGGVRTRSGREASGGAEENPTPFRERIRTRGRRGASGDSDENLTPVSEQMLSREARRVKKGRARLVAGHHSPRPLCDVNGALGALADLTVTKGLETHLHPRRTRVARSHPQPIPKAGDLYDAGLSSSSTLSLAQEPVTVTTSALEHEIALYEPYRARTPTSSPRPLTEAQISLLMNFGSEEEVSDDEGNLRDALPFTASLFTANVQRTDREAAIWKVDLDNEMPPELDTEPQLATPDVLGYKPANLFDFEWKELPKPPIATNLRREAFSYTNTGPTSTYDSPYDAFIAVWDQAIMEEICLQTNIYAQQHADNLMLSGSLCPQSRITKWVDITINELYVYFAITISMGILILSRIQEYWSNNKDVFQVPGYKIHMSLTRYKLISAALHFNDNERMNVSFLSSSMAKLFKIKPLVDHLNRKFSQLYNLSRNVVLDESLTQWESLLKTNQIVSNKVAVGIKTYEVYESHSGYLWRFEMHSGFEHPQDSGPVSGAIPSIVLRLLQGLENKGHTIWMDNSYNSPALARVLKTRGFDCVGTLSTNREFVPVELATLLKSQMPQDDAIGSTSGDVDLLVWRDKNRVALISTYHGAAATRCAGGVLKPSVFHDYNLCMRGVDKKNQILAMYPFERQRTRVWYKKLFRRLLNVSVQNAYIIYKHNTNIDHRSFRKTLVNQILNTHSLNQTKSIDMVCDRVKFTPEVLAHMPLTYDMLPGGGGKLRRKCKICRKRTQTYCPSCDIPLCFWNGDQSGSGCYAKYHS